MSAAIFTASPQDAASSLLARALQKLWLDAHTDIKSFSDLDERGHPVPGTFDDDMVDFIIEDLALIRDIESHLGFQRPELGPTWLDDLIERRGAYAGSVL